MGVRLLSALAVVLGLVAGVGEFNKFTNQSQLRQPPIYAAHQLSGSLPIYTVEWASDGERKFYSLHGGNEYISASPVSWLGDAQKIFLSWTCIGNCDVDPEKNQSAVGREVYVGQSQDFDTKLLTAYRDRGRNLARKKWPEAFENKQPAAPAER